MTDLHNAGATLLTGVVFVGCCHWCVCFGGTWWKIPWEPQSCLWSHTQTNKAAHQDILIGMSLCSSHQHCVYLHCPLSVELVSPLVITSSWRREHTSWNGFPHTGHHVMKECYHCLDLFAPAFIRAKERQEDIPRYAAHTINCTLEGCSLYPAQVTAIC